MTGRETSVRRQRGQVIPLLALLIVVIVLFIGLAIDFGFAYVTRAKLSKAVDAAALAGIRNVTVQGETQAKAIANSSFNINYGATDRDANPPAVTMSFVNDSSGAKFLNVDAVATINTFFIRILPQWRTLNVTAHAQAKRAPLVMSLLLDRSGSMTRNGGWSALPPAVETFIDYFDDDIDRVSLESFATGHEVNVKVKKNFKAAIHSNAGGLSYNKFDGGTFAQGSFQDAKAQNDAVADPQVLKVVVFFTDGYANMNQDTLGCSNTPLIYGGCTVPEQNVGWCNGVSFFPSTITNINQTSGLGCNSRTFPSALNGGRSTTISVENVSNDAMYRSEQLADTLRSQGTIVYAIGLGDFVSEAFLNNLANTPQSDTFNSHQPQGAVVIAPTANDLEDAFRRIAEQILFRLTQ